MALFAQLYQLVFGAVPAWQIKATVPGLVAFALITVGVVGGTRHWCRHG